MIKLKGQIILGHGQAEENLHKQEPFLKKYIPNIETYHKGTINVLLDRPLVIKKADIETDLILWDTRQNPVTGEKFGFVNIKLEIIAHDENPVDALIYIGHKSPHCADPCHVEVLAPKLNIGRSDCCNIVIDKDVKEEGDNIIIE